MADGADALEPIYVDLGRRVLTERHRAGWTQADLAGQVGLNRTSIANVEAGRQRLMLHQVEALADAFGVSLSTMLGVIPPNSDRLRKENGDLRRQVAMLEQRLTKISQIAREN